MSLIGKPIEEIIETLYNSIKNKRQVINQIKNEYNIENDNYKEIKINRLKLVDLLDEFEVTISQSLQAIQTLKVEIFNLKEKQATEEILNLTNDFQLKYNNNDNENNNIIEKLEDNKKENQIIEPKNFQKINIDNINNNINNNNNKNINNKSSINQNLIKEINSLTETKLNFDYSSLLNNSEFSLKESFSNLDKFMNDNGTDNNNKKNNEQMNNAVLITDKEDYSKNKIKSNDSILKNNKIEEKIQSLNNNLNNKIEYSNINLKEEEIIEDQPSKLNIDITQSNRDLINKASYSENKSLRQNINYFSIKNSNNNINNKNNCITTNQEELNLNKTYNYNFNNLSNLNDLNNKKENTFCLKSDKEKNQTIVENNIFNKSNDDIKYSNKNDVKNNNIFSNNINDINNDEYSIKTDIKNNYDESDIISIASKKEILLEKINKIEEEEKISKLIEEVFNEKSFKLYILDKYGNGKYDIFLKKIKDGLINFAELESDLNTLKELSLKNKKTFNQKDNRPKININKNIYNNKMKGTINDINSINIINNYNTDNNISEKNSSKNFKKIDNEKNKKCKNNFKNKNINNYEQRNIQTTIRKREKVINSSNNSFINQNKKLSSHSVSSIRARLKRKQF